VKSAKRFATMRGERPTGRSAKRSANRRVARRTITRREKSGKPGRWSALSPAGVSSSPRSISLPNTKENNLFF
jgi:hypothetical protein